MKGSFTEKALFLKAFFLLPGIWVALRVFGFAKVERMASATRAHPRPRFGTAEQVIRNVQRAARLAPGASCLPQAIAVKLLMTRRGLAAQLRIGVARDARGALAAHAWVEGEGWTAPCGPVDLHAFTRLTKYGDHGIADGR